MNKIDNKENILKVALKLFSDKGYQSVGVQEIVTTANITKPTLYHYYGNKKGLLESILKRYYSEMIDRLKKVSLYDGDLIKTLTSFTEEYFNYSEQNKEFFYLQLSMTFVPPSNEVSSIIEPFHKEFNELIIDIFKQSIWSHGNVRNNADILARTLSGSLNFYALGIINGSLEKDEDLVYKFVKQYIYGVYTL